MLALSEQEKTRDLAKRSAAKSDVAMSEASVGRAQQGEP